MFQKIVVAYDDSPQAERALATAVELVKCLQGELQTVTVVEDLPAYTSYAAIDSSMTQSLQDDRLKFYRELRAKALLFATRCGVEIRSNLITGGEIQGILEFLREQKADLLVVGLHPRDLYISRLWSTVYGLAQDAPCHVLGVH